jgi:hypothetical protein
MMELFFDRQGNPINTAEFTGLMQTNTEDYRRVAEDEINGVRVSTVWLGIDLGFGSGPPLIFETMTFPANPENPASSDWNDRCWRYATEAQAVAGHEAICAQLRAGLEFVVKEED